MYFECDHSGSNPCIAGFDLSTVFIVLDGAWIPYEVDHTSGPGVGWITWTNRKFHCMRASITPVLCFESLSLFPMAGLEEAIHKQQ